MKSLFKHFVLFMLAIITFISCDPDDVKPNPTTGFENGAFIVNEGDFSSGYGTLDFFSRKTGEVSHSVFQTSNNNETLGSVAQSMCITNSNIYVVVNNSNKVVVIDPITFLKKNEIINLHQPRYMVVHGNKGYISQWGDDGFTGSVAVVDINTFLIINVIKLGHGPERLFVDGDKLYIPRSGGYGRDSLISILDLNTDSPIDSLVVGDNPRGIVKDKNGDFWVTASGYSDWNNPENNTMGKLVHIIEDEIVSSFEIPNGSLNPVTSKNGDYIYFLDNAFWGQGIFRIDVDNPQLDEPFIAQTFYNLSIDPKTGDLFCSDVKDYSSEGEVIIYNEEGEEKSRVTSGIIPGNVYFVD